MRTIRRIAYIVFWPWIMLYRFLMVDVVLNVLCFLAWLVAWLVVEFLVMIVGTSIRQTAAPTLRAIRYFGRRRREAVLDRQRQAREAEKEAQLMARRVAVAAQEQELERERLRRDAEFAADRRAAGERALRALEKDLM